MALRSVSMSGTATGNGECFCLQVTEEEYRRIEGEEAYQMEMELAEELGCPKTFFCLCPGALVRNLTKTRHPRVKITVELLEEGHENPRTAVDGDED